MKKRMCVIFQLLMSVIMIGLGLVIELIGEVKVHGIFALALIIPGVVLAIQLLLGRIFKKKNFIAIIISAFLILAADAAVLYLFKLFNMSYKGYIALAVIDLIAILIGIMFNAINENAK